MARNFDKDADSRRGQRLDPENLTFVLNGRTFRVISGYAPDAPGEDAMTEWRAADFEELSNEQFALLADRTITRFLKPGQEADWKLARDPEAADPITGSDLVDVVAWLLEAVVNRPLVQSSASSTGSTNPTEASPGQAAPIGQRLTVVSPSQAAKASEA